jgi:hypothetical protein
MNDTAEAMNAAEDRRELDFRENEDARERIFNDNEHRRAEEAAKCQNQIWRDLEDRLNSIALHVPPPVTVPASVEPVTEAPKPVVDEPAGAQGEIPSVHREDDSESVVDSMRRAATIHADEIREAVRLEREQLEREREESTSEREMMLADLRAERARLDEEHAAKIRALEEELATVKTVSSSCN